MAKGRGNFSDTMSGLNDMPIYGRGIYGVRTFASDGCNIQQYQQIQAFKVIQRSPLLCNSITTRTSHNVTRHKFSH